MTATALLSASDARARLGISDHSWRVLLMEYDIEPCRIRGGGWRGRGRHLFSEAAVNRIMQLMQAIRRGDAPPRLGVVETLPREIVTPQHNAHVRARLSHVRSEAIRRALEERARRNELSASRIAELGTLSVDALIPRALECMHALNRRAKYLRGAGRYATGPIYDLKDAFLRAMVRAARAQVYTFEETRESRQQYCCGCGREWIGDSYCYECCDDSGEPTMETVRWFVVDCGGGYRFHSPGLPEDLARVATEIEPHNPTQPLRDVPDLGLTEEAMRATITAATQRLTEALANTMEMSA